MQCVGGVEGAESLARRDVVGSEANKVLMMRIPVSKYMLQIRSLSTFYLN